MLTIEESSRATKRIFVSFTLIQPIAWSVEFLRFLLLCLITSKNPKQRKLQSLLDAEVHPTRTESNAEDLQRQRQMRQRMDIDDTDIVVAGANPIRISRKQVQYFLIFPISARV